MKLAVTADLAGSRLDAFLVRAGGVASAGAARRLVEQGAVRVDGRPGRKGQLLATGQTVELAASADEPAVLPDPAMPLVVLYQDAAMVAVNKPAGWPTHPLRPGERGTLASALVARFPECATASRDAREAGFVHRLDTGTSGVVLAARDPEGWLALRRIVGGERCEKTYLAEVVPPPAPMNGADIDRTVVEAAIGRRGRRSGQVRVGAGRGLLPARTEVVVRQRRRTQLAGRGPPAPWPSSPGAGAPRSSGDARAGRSFIWRRGRPEGGGGAGGRRVSPACLAHSPGSSEHWRRAGHRGAAARLGLTRSSPEVD